ncbi:N-acyl homoserine lactonase family protein [Mesorhizobium sp. YR577]|uniref:N-acyl homoserine lactonase family protein n=1 Tax=Mesorhizobium sp. YR577 TaxID=1884373 RepID=UPI0008EEBCBE|nr:N-acyl homoserine lactonase family protein [Mesorhizobium sp. YR577]SFU16166.1 Glyoxylase, beta-lactamase superfamily II [Mesorhizobium sp. YR577]
MPDMTGPEPFELFALKYARHGGRKANDNFIGGDLHEAGSDLFYYVWVARRSDKLFVIDTGFGPDAAKQRGRELDCLPAEALGRLCIAAADVDQVILTHLHYDHAGTLGHFRKACFHVQAKEAAYSTGPCMCHSFLRHPFDVEDIVSFVRLNFAGRIAFHDETTELADGLTLHRTGGHSGGLQVVRVWTRRGWVVIASDATHLYANYRSNLAFPAVYHVGELLDGYRTIRRLADSDDHVIPGHDPMVMRLYPALSPALEGIAVRLDVPPRES